MLKFMVLKLICQFAPQRYEIPLEKRNIKIEILGGKFKRLSYICRMDFAACGIRTELTNPLMAKKG
jgi:hypothetical protein